MMRRYNRLLVALFVVSDTLLGIAAFIVAYLLRFETGLPVIKGVPPFAQYMRIAPFIGLLVPIAFQVQGIYRLRRGRSRVDDFFGVFVGSILAVVLGLGGTLYVQTYYVSEVVEGPRASTKSRRASGCCSSSSTSRFSYASREVVREVLERRWRAGIGLKRVLIAGAGDLGRVVADKVLEHRELGFKVVGFLDDKAIGDHIGYRGIPLMGPLAAADDIIRRERVDQLYVALPLEEHVKMLGLVEATNREGVDVHVVPDLLQFIALRARLENLDGVPIISLNDVPLRGFNSLLKRATDVAISAAALAALAVPFGIVALLIRRTSKGPVLYRQERMGLDGRAIRGLQVPLDVRRCGGRHRARCGRATMTRAARRSASGSAASTSTSCRSSGMSSRGTCRSSARGRNVPTSSSSSSTESRSTCCDTRSRPALPAGRRSTAGEATPRSRSGSNTTCITSRTGPSHLT